MTEKDETEILSRRQFSILGLATLGLALSPTVLMVSEAEAQPSTVLKFGATATPETVTQRRLARRQARTQRRQERREARTQRRRERRQARAERRRTRRGTTPATSTTPQ
jgi:hypothetical protein